jgi:hypothetical protein
MTGKSMEENKKSVSGNALFGVFQHPAQHDRMIMSNESRQAADLLLLLST